MDIRRFIHVCLWKRFFSDFRTKFDDFRNDPNFVHSFEFSFSLLLYIFFYKQVDITSTLLWEIKQARDVSHENTVRFVGNVTSQAFYFLQKFFTFIYSSRCLYWFTATDCAHFNGILSERCENDTTLKLRLILKSFRR